MKSQSHIKPVEGPGWYRCKRVEFSGGTATWELSQTGRYSFSEAYRMSPHRQLMQASDDDALRAFVKAWGPLRFSLDTWSGSDPIEVYRTERDKWTAGVRFLTSVEEPEMQRSALLRLAEFRRTDSEPPFQFFLNMLRTPGLFQIPGSLQQDRFDEDLHRWLETATQKQIEAATVFLVPRFAHSAWIPGFSVVRSGSRNVLRASLGIHSLLDALSWMVWQDVLQSHPIKFCAECRGLIDSTYKYEKKFCSYECAHRQTSRESAKRKREERKRNNGTKKTR
jgi:hypothetical protein